jgi:hypothetical protein
MSPAAGFFEILQSLSLDLNAIVTPCGMESSNSSKDSLFFNLLYHWTKPGHGFKTEWAPAVHAEFTVSSELNRVSTLILIQHHTCNDGTYPR